MDRVRLVETATERPMYKDQLNREKAKLEQSGRMLHIEEVRDSVAEKSDDLPVPKSQRTELDEGSRACQNGAVELHNWKFVYDSIRVEYQ